MLDTIDYFIKWVEVEALPTITKAKIQNFVWKNTNDHIRQWTTVR